MRHPLLYEVNTRCWLAELGRRAGRPLTLDQVPEAEITAWAAAGFTHIWLMGVWETTTESVAFSRQPAQRRHWTKDYPDLRTEDIGGSPYAIGDYQVARSLGGNRALAGLRAKLAARNLRLVLDFIPNHAGLGHPWISAHPDWFVHSANRRAGTFRAHTTAGPLWVAHGKDPFFPAWADTAQMDYRNPNLRHAVSEALLGVAARCDGVRCDMAMLVLNEVFEKNWAAYPAPFPAPASEFWPEAIARTRTKHPEFLFIAEAYWNLEARLLAQGFDYAYDKRFLDLVWERNPPLLQKHLYDQTPEVLERGVRFLENHDEPRVAGRLKLPEHQAAAWLLLGLPGMRLVHEGQLTGAARHASVHLNRRYPENPTPDILAMYRRYLEALRASQVGSGQWQWVQPQPAWPDNPTANNLITVQWQGAGPEFDLVVVNMAEHPSQCRLPLKAPNLERFRTWSLRDLLGPERSLCDGPELRNPGLFVDLAPYAAQLLRVEPAGAASTT